MLGTKEDFELIRQQVNIEAVADMLMRKQGRAYIYPGERTGSVYIYPKTNTFYDFGRAVGGDVIRLWSHIKGCNSWTALKEITETFGLNMPDRKDPALIKQQEQARQVRLKAEQAEKRRWRLQVEALQRECEFYQDILDSGHCEPLSWLWCICRNRLTIFKIFMINLKYLIQLKLITKQ